MWHGKCVSKSVRLARGSRPARGKPLRSRGARNEMSQQFFHKFLLNDTFAPAERFVSVHAPVSNTFNVQRHLMSRPTHRQFRTAAHQSWSVATAAGASIETLGMTFLVAGSFPCPCRTPRT